jgi:hypothetical protein
VILDKWIRNLEIAKEETRSNIMLSELICTADGIDFPSYRNSVSKSPVSEHFDTLAIPLGTAQVWKCKSIPLYNFNNPPLPTSPSVKDILSEDTESESENPSPKEFGRRRSSYLKSSPDISTLGKFIGIKKGFGISIGSDDHTFEGSKDLKGSLINGDPSSAKYPLSSQVPNMTEKKGVTSSLGARNLVETVAKYDIPPIVARKFNPDPSSSHPKLDEYFPGN